MNALMTKFLFYAPLIGIFMPLFSTVTTKDAVITAFLAALAAFLTADLVVYPRFGNISAVITDVVITLIVIFEMSIRTGSVSSWFGFFAFSILIASGELYYHPYLDRVIFSSRRR